MAKSTAPTPRRIDILGNTWTARHLARQLLETQPRQWKLRLWSDAKGSPDVASSTDEALPKMMIVPDFLKDHKGLGFRTNIAGAMIHYRQRRRDLWDDPRSTAAKLGTCPEVLALLHDLIFFNSYGASVLSGDRLKAINYDWQKHYDGVYRGAFVPPATVIAAKASIERVWDNTLEHQGAELNYLKPVNVESVRPPSKNAPLALILSAPHGVLDDTDCVVQTQSDHLPEWLWCSYRCVVSRELVASLPRFFVWIDPDRGEDFLATGLLHDGAILRVISVPLPHNEDKVLVQVDRLTNAQDRDVEEAKNFFPGSPWHALENESWTAVPVSASDDRIFGGPAGADAALKRLAKRPISALATSATGIRHHEIW